MKIVALDGHTLNPGDNSWKPVEELGDLTVYPRTNPEDLFSRADGAEIIVTNKVRLSSKMIHSLKKLRFIAVTATGFDHVALDAARDREIPVSNVPGYSTASVAQHTFALLLELTNRVALHNDSVQNGDWIRSPDFSYWRHPISELDGKTLGVIGFGSIGQAVARIGSSFGMKILVSSRTRRTDAPAEYEWVSQEDLAARSDVVTLHCPQTAETQAMVDASFFQRMKSSALIINTSRGGLILEADLAAALRSGTIAGAAVDVLSAEPMPEGHPLLNCENCVVTPHLAWASLEARQRLMKMTADNIAAFQQGNPTHVVN